MRVSFIPAAVVAAAVLLLFGGTASSYPGPRRRPPGSRAAASSGAAPCRRSRSRDRPRTWAAASATSAPRRGASCPWTRRPARSRRRGRSWAGTSARSSPTARAAGSSADCSGRSGSSRIDNLAHIKADGTLDTDWTGSVDSAVNALVLAGGTLYVGGEFSAARSAAPGRAGTPGRLRRGDRRADELRPVPVDGPATRRHGPRALRLDALRRRVLRRRSARAAAPDLAAVDTASGTLTAWAPSVDDSVTGIAVGATGTVYVTGYFANANDVDRAFAAAFAPDGALASWDPEPGGPVYAVTASPSTASIWAETSAASARSARQGLAAVDPVTGAPTSWNPADRRRRQLARASRARRSTRAAASRRSAATRRATTWPRSTPAEPERRPRSPP